MKPCVKRMPKTGLSDKEWISHMYKFAEGSFSFGRGQQPSKNSKWAKVLLEIEKCPLHKGSATVDLFGRHIVCVFAFHKKQVNSSS